MICVKYSEIGSKRVMGNTPTVKADVIKRYSTMCNVFNPFAADPVKDLHFAILV